MRMVNDVEHDWSLEERNEYFSQQEKVHRKKLILYSSLESRLDIPKGFIDKLHSEPDDWAYIVKLAVLCEAAVTHALVASVGNDSNREIWYDHFSNLSNFKRLELAHKLSIFSKNVREQLDAVGQFRNSFAHEVKNLGGSLSDFFKYCSPDKKRELSSKLLGIKHTHDHDWNFYIANTRLLIAIGALSAIKTLAAIGLDSADVDELERRWESADIYQSEPSFSAGQQIFSEPE
ncbi:hypothetical protein O3301_08315 [Janthinobacterium sp. SUN211]|uniref:hypothetical protein n=1 Tax=Janthinobacterium sp. SUN211 TaxID=3014786 RepID=UPI002712472F|nr:hypothetical protein [Janthinobacterium sp. SUN211]MDO8048468.1 hypothetical protein [Janthinobacterium sp. SUN211]